MGASAYAVMFMVVKRQVNNFGMMTQSVWIGAFATCYALLFTSYTNKIPNGNNIDSDLAINHTDDLGVTSKNQLVLD